MQKILVSESTAANRRIPVYLVDATDGYTPETGLTFSGSEIQLSKDGGAEASFAGSMTEVGHGLYYYAPTTGEIDTLGFLVVRVLKTGTTRQFVGVVQIVSNSPYIAPAAANVTQINGSTLAATNAALDYAGLPIATVLAVTSNGDFTVSGLSATDDVYDQMFMVFVSGNNKGIARKVSLYTGATGRCQFAGTSPSADRPFPLNVVAADVAFLIGIGG